MVSHDYYLDFGVIRYILAFYSGGRNQESGVRRQEIIFIYSPHTPHPTPHTLHPTPVRTSA
ncbi:hypothetical protein [Microcystis aeruginosa]|uniref:hypothetical protein n=1 Tax=Microcystis aeruginosa TaxID=1126 RepID=UPI0013302C39|nr:hypothetical protein [Microcystis aeruginosa]